MQDKKRTAAIFIMIAALTIGTCGLASYIWMGIQQRKAHDKLTEQVVESREESEEAPAEPTEPETEEAYVSPIDFKILWEQNEDVAAWIQIPGTQINYPVVHGEDNDYYLHHDLNGQETVAGTIFLDYEDEPDFSSQHNILYGHHMRNGSMFKDIVQFKNQEYFNEHPEVILYLPDREIHLKTLAAVVASADGIRRKTEFSSEEEFTSYIGKMTEKASASAPAEGTITRLYSFITCSYEFQNARTILYAYETEEEE